mmetsp:Transcript_20596/g.33951  ORF Transcript_20596/g.33951 Transcript_20596/m.33951 type:complete len:100 (+) Transcript_20596:1263-1562(+)
MMDPEALFVTRIFNATCACREVGLTPCGEGLELSVPGDADDGGGDKLEDSVSTVVLIASGSKLEASTSSLAVALCAAAAACFTIVYNQQFHWRVLLRQQ